MRDFFGQSLTEIVGGKTAKALSTAFSMRNVGDLLRHYPRRYAERGELTDLASLREGENVTVLAQVVEATTRPMKQRRGSILEVVVTDGSRRLSLTFFNAAAWQARQFRSGRHGMFAGQVSSFRGRQTLTHPDYELLPDGVEDDPDLVAAFASPLIPIYPATKSVTTWRLQRMMQLGLEHLALAADQGEVPDPIPERIRSERHLISVVEALTGIHRPTSSEQIDLARHRLKYEEAFTLQALLAQRREQARALPATRRTPANTPLLDAFDAGLPFTLTRGQVAVGAEIAGDMAQGYPMHRLLQGDVGSGKTIVALRAMLLAVDAGGQAALLAPTEVLASQHYRSIRSMLGALGRRGELDGSVDGTKVALLTGSQKTSTRRRELLDVVSGDAGIVVGTHALLQEHVDFHDLALVVIDEQHRFGVEQRAALAAKSRDGARPHVLVMTATPIPRTVAMTVFGDVDVSTLDEVPAGRAAVVTHVVSSLEQPAHVRRMWERAREEVRSGHRVFVVCPRIGDEDGAGEEESSDESIALTGVIPLAAELQEFEDLRIGILHGRMAGEEKDDVMRRFSNLDATDGIEVLVSTTVVEVGVDVPDATMMVVMDADRFGISQLHQLRGRIGRGSLPGLCILVTTAPAGSPARERLDAVAATTDGFELAALDLEIRREGDVLGASQSGRRSSLRLLEVTRDADLIAMARMDAAQVIATDPELANAPALRSVLTALDDQERADYLERG